MTRRHFTSIFFSVAAWFVTKAFPKRLPTAAEVLSTIPIVDSTASYEAEVARWVSMETTTEIATCRVTSISRLLAEQGIIPQTMRWVESQQKRHLLSDELSGGVDDRSLPDAPSRE